MSKHRLYFSHSYDPEELRFNEHFWKLLMAAEFYAWIDTGRDTLPGDESRQSGARRPMDVSFNEWMMSQCDGFVAVVPKRRKSAYQLLEYRTAVRMGVPRLVLLEQGGIFDAPRDEIVSFPTSWNLFWQAPAQTKISVRIYEFAEIVQAQKSANLALKFAGRWRPRENNGLLDVALLAPKTSDPEWQKLQALLQESDEIDWTLLSPANIQYEAELVQEAFDLLIVDVGACGTPREALGFIHALGIPQIRLCRISDGGDASVVERFLDAGQKPKASSFYEVDPIDGEAILTPVPRFLRGFKLDAKMQPVICWRSAREATVQILGTTQRILAFRSGLSPDEGGIAETIDTHESAKRYFDQYWQRACRGSVFISFAGHGRASGLADRLAQILRFQGLRCFHYRDKDSSSDGRLETGEDVAPGLKLRVDQADIAIYLIEEHFTESEFCLSELNQGRALRDKGLIEFRAYALETLAKFPQALDGTSLHSFRDIGWTHSDVEQKVVSDVAKSVEVLGWALRESERNTLSSWLKQDQRDTSDSACKLLQSQGVSEKEIKAVADAMGCGDAWLNGFLKLPRERERQERTRQIVALLLLAVSQVNPERRRTVAHWLYERRLLQWPPFVDSQPEDHVPIKDVFINVEHDLTPDEMKLVGQKVGQQYGREFLGSRRPLCVTADANFMAVPVEWAAESQHDEPLAVRKPVRWRLPDAGSRVCIFDSIAANDIPPTALLLALAGPDINPKEQIRRLGRLLRERYERLGWPPEFVVADECQTVQDVFSRLRGCQEQVLHIAGHMGGAGLQVGGISLAANELSAALRGSDVRLAVLNGCEAGKPTSYVASAYLTLADRLVRDANVPEIVAHRCKISEDDALIFAESFHTSFFSANDGFEVARAAMTGRRAGSTLLRYSPVVISQREAGGLRAGSR